MEQGVQTGQLGERKLTTVHAIGQSLAIGPIFSAGLLTGLVAGVAGFNSPLSVLLGTVGALCLAYVVSLFARRFSGAGAIYEYLVHGGHPVIGAAGAGLWVAGGLTFMGIWTVVGFLAESFFAAHLALHVTWWIWGAIAMLIAVGLNHLGVRPAIRGVLLLAALSVIPFLILAIVIIAKGGATGNTLSALGTGQSSLNSVFKGVLFALLLFIGFEAAAAVGEECEEPHRSIPIALLGSVMLAGLFYLVVTYAAAIGFGVKGAAQAWPADPSPMGALAQQYVGRGLSTLIDLVVLLDAFSVGIAFVVAVSRVIFALGRDRLLPSVLATTTRRETPLGANLLLLPVGVLALMFAGLTHYGDALKIPNLIEAFTIGSSTGSFLIEAVYAILAIVSLRLIWGGEPRARWWRIPIAVVGLATPVLAYKGSLSPWPTYPADRGIIFAFVWFGLIILWIGYLQLRHPERLARAAGHATVGPGHNPHLGTEAPPEAIDVSLASTGISPRLTDPRDNPAAAPHEHRT